MSEGERWELRTEAESESAGHDRQRFYSTIKRRIRKYLIHSKVSQRVIHGRVAASPLDVTVYRTTRLLED